MKPTTEDWDAIMVKSLRALITHLMHVGPQSSYEVAEMLRTMGENATDPDAIHTLRLTTRQLKTTALTVAAGMASTVLFIEEIASK